MNKKKMCPDCLKYEKQGHNYCRMCGYHFTSGRIQNISRSLAYSIKEKYCGDCGALIQKCSCSGNRRRDKSK